jgi:hypothetical protein
VFFDAMRVKIRDEGRTCWATLTYAGSEASRRVF